MLLTRDEICVAGGAYQLHDCIIPHLYLRELHSAGSPQAWFAVISLGSVDAPEMKFNTESFSLMNLKDHQEIYTMWRRRISIDRSVHYLNFLLCSLRESSRLHLTFLPLGERMDRFQVQLGNISVTGRLPTDVNLLLTHFQAETTVLD